MIVMVVIINITALIVATIQHDRNSSSQFSASLS